MIKKKIEQNFISKYLLVGITAILISRVIFPGGVIPLGYGFFAASLEYNVNSVFAAVCVCLGAVSTGFNARSLIVIISSLFLWAFKILMGNNKKFVHNLVPFLAAGIISSLAVVIVNGFILYDFLMALIQNAISLVAYFIFQNTLRAFTTRSGRYIFKEDISSLAATLILCVFGLPQVNFFGLNLRNVVGLYLIILFTYKGSTGLISKIGKLGMCAAVLILSSSAAVMLGMPENIMSLLWEVIAADVIFFITPEKLMKKLKLPGGSNINTVVEKANYSDQMTSMMVGRLENFSKSYSVLANSFAKFAGGENKEVNNNKVLINKVCSRVCERCDMTEFCWKRMRTETTGAFLELCELLERNGRIVWDSVPEFFKDECERTEIVLTELRVGYEVARVEKIWAQKLSESKDVYAMQLGSLSKAAHNLALEMKSDIKLMVKLSETLETDLRKAGYKGAKATVIQNRFGKYEVTLDYNGRIDNIIHKVISGVLGRKMIWSQDTKYIEANRFRIETGMSGIAKNPKDISGDSYTFINGGSGYFTAVLCDGMGTGQKAREQSNMAINMIENFSYNGFDNETAIEMINSALVMKSEEDSYSTLDLVSVNLQNGNVEILKYGGMPTIIKHKLEEAEYTAQRQYLPKVETVSSNTLPVGIMNRVSSRTVKKKVSSGDCIVMMTDGVFDSYRQLGKSTGDLIRYIEVSDGMQPQEMADNILKEALNINTVSYKMASGGTEENAYDNIQPTDDMTVLVLIVGEE